MKLHPVAIATIAVIGTATALVISGASAAPSTTQQLQINQKISQAAVIRSNQSLNYLAPIRTTTTDAVNTGKAGVTRLSSVVGSGLGWTTAQIASGAVTTAKIASGAVTSAQIANGAVTTAKIANAAVTNANLANPIYVAQITGPGTISTLTPGVTAAQGLPAGVNLLTFTVPVGVATCTFAATITGAAPGFATVASSSIAGTTATVTVETFSASTGGSYAAAVLATLPVHIIAYC